MKGGAWQIETQQIKVRLLFIVLVSNLDCVSGVIQQYMKDPANAMNDFQQAIEADPTYSLAYFNAANLYFNMRLFEKALKYYDAAVKNCVDDEGAVLNRFVCTFSRIMLYKHANYSLGLATFWIYISMHDHHSQGDS